MPDTWARSALWDPSFFGHNMHPGSHPTLNGPGKETVIPNTTVGFAPTICSHSSQELYEIQKIVTSSINKSFSKEILGLSAETLKKEKIKQIIFCFS